MAERIYNQQIFENDAAEYDDGTLGFDWGGLIGGGIQAGVGLLTKPKGPKGPKPLYEGYEITAALDAMWADWNANKTGVGDGLALLEMAKSIKAWLADTTAFDSRAIANNEYLANTRRAIDAEITRLQAAPAGATQTMVDPATGQVVTVAATDDGQIIDGISNTTLLLAVAAIGGIFLLTRGN